jgi:hypothetical protein
MKVRLAASVAAIALLGSLGCHSYWRSEWRDEIEEEHPDRVCLDPRAKLVKTIDLEEDAPGGRRDLVYLVDASPPLPLPYLRGIFVLSGGEAPAPPAGSFDVEILGFGPEEVSTSLLSRTGEPLRCLSVDYPSTIPDFNGNVLWFPWLLRARFERSVSWSDLGSIAVWIDDGKRSRMVKLPLDASDADPE